ncbi:hypothetical protein [Kutzneria sp. NPDC051319]|uniref:hypothetical protein n=1 Tax=Kutzneria sp. NPDC051319 TaxID=3155047 RepID=UPI00343DF2DE
MLPSPIDHVTDVGVAVAVTDTPGTETVADTVFHPPDNHSQVGNDTNCSPLGLAAMAGAGNCNCLRAISAS